MTVEILTTKDIGIVVPLHVRETLTKSEQISLKHLRTYLDRYDKYFVAARKLNLDQIDKSGFKIMKFPNKFFGSRKANSMLMTEIKFYKAFSKYKYILIYQLDCLVFSDRLLEWCEKGYDYVGAPWLASELTSFDKSAVGNGGFSLRNVSSFIKLYSKGKYWLEPEEFAQKIISRIPILKTPFHYLLKNVLKIKSLNNVRIHLLYYKNKNEDKFISFYSSHYCPNFRIPTVEESLDFAFEVNPRKCYELNNKRMPFGCHAYERFDYSFWKPYLLKSE